jgi:hypothetical protein
MPDPGFVAPAWHISFWGDALAIYKTFGLENKTSQRDGDFLNYYYI